MLIERLPQVIREKKGCSGLDSKLNIIRKDVDQKCAIYQRVKLDRISTEFLL